MVAALGEANRLPGPGGQVAVCNWGRMEDREVFAVLNALRELLPDEPDPNRPAVGEPGVVEGLLHQAGLEPLRVGEVDVPYRVPDEATLERALLVDAADLENRQLAESAVRTVIAGAAKQFRRRDGSYRFENRFTFVVARA
jgi:hypothetical protein